MRLAKNVIVVAVLLSGLASPVDARLIEATTYQQELDTSDLVVIATPITKTKDTKEKIFFSGVSFGDSNGKQHKIEGIGVETTFSVDAVFKGDAHLKEFTLHHYREVITPDMSVNDLWSLNGLTLVSFDPSDSSKRSSYLLFLMREPDGRYAATGTQIDPGLLAIVPLPIDMIHEITRTRKEGK